MGGTHLSFYIIKQLPVLRPEEFDKPFCNTTIKLFILPRVFELTYTSWSLKSVAIYFNNEGTPFIWDEDRRFIIKCELDALFFFMYGLNEDEINYVMDTFPIVKRNDIEKHGIYRTKEAIFEIYSKIKIAINTGQNYQTILDPPPGESPRSISKS